MISISLLAFFTKTYLYKIITDNNQARSVKPKLLYRPEKSYNIYQFLTLYKNPVIWDILVHKFITCGFHVNFSSTATPKNFIQLTLLNTLLSILTFMLSKLVFEHHDTIKNVLEMLIVIWLLLIQLDNFVNSLFNVATISVIFCLWMNIVVSSANNINLIFSLMWTISLI